MEESPDKLELSKSKVLRGQAWAAFQMLREMESAGFVRKGEENDDGDMGKERRDKDDEDEEDKYGEEILAPPREDEYIR